MPEVGVRLELNGATHQSVSVWRDNVQAGDAGDDVATWLTEFLGQDVRLFALTDKTQRITSTRYNALPSQVSFADGYPLLITTEESLANLNERLAVQGKPPVAMERFRPNIVLKGTDTPFAEDHWTTFEVNGGRFDIVKPCARCAITTVDPETGVVVDTKEPLTTLATFRRGANGGVMFGYNVIHRANIELTLGDVVTVA